MNVLLDTNALLWSLLKPDRLSTLARRVIEEAETVHVSAASIYEIDFKREKLKAGGARREDSFLTRMPNNMREACRLWALPCSTSRPRSRRARPGFLSTIATHGTG